MEDGDDSRRLAKLVAELLIVRTQKGGGHEDYLDEFKDEVLDQARLLPVGSATCAFWLADPDHSLCLSVRVVDRGRSKPGGYQGQVIPLSDEDWTALLAEVAARPGERLEVARLADMASITQNPMGGGGRHLLALTLGGWGYVRQLGSFEEQPIDPELRDAVLRRVAPSRLVRLEHEVADGASLAERILSWLSAPGPWQLDGRVWAVEAWARRVAELARACASKKADGERRSVSARLLQQAPALTKPQPLSGLADALGVQVGDLVRLVWDSASSPASAPWLDDRDDETVVGTCFRRGIDGWDVALVATAAKSETS
jgi:hypothetical protein